MSLDGMLFQGQPMKIRRPKDYQPPVGGEQAAPTIHVPGKFLKFNLPRVSALLTFCSVL